MKSMNGWSSGSRPAALQAWMSAVRGQSSASQFGSPPVSADKSSPPNASAARRGEAAAISLTNRTPSTVSMRQIRRTPSGSFRSACITSAADSTFDSMTKSGRSAAALNASKSARPAAPADCCTG